MSVSEVLDVVSAWLSPCWQFFELEFPLFGISFKSIFIGLALASIAIRVVKRVLSSPEYVPKSFPFSKSDSEK